MADMKAGDEVILRAVVTRVGDKKDGTFTVWIENYPIPITLPLDAPSVIEVKPLRGRGKPLI